jgi:hypothetical protein
MELGVTQNPLGRIEAVGCLTVDPDPQQGLVTAASAHPLGLSGPKASDSCNRLNRIDPGADQTAGRRSLPGTLELDFRNGRAPEIEKADVQGRRGWVLHGSDLDLAGGSAAAPLKHEYRGIIEEDGRFRYHTLGGECILAAPPTLAPPETGYG